MYSLYKMMCFVMAFSHVYLSFAKIHLSLSFISLLLPTELI